MPSLRPQTADTLPSGGTEAASDVCGAWACEEIFSRRWLPRVYERTMSTDPVVRTGVRSHSGGPTPGPAPRLRGGVGADGRPALEVTPACHYSRAHLCWRLPPDRVAPKPPVPLGTTPVAPPNASEVRG